MSPYKKQKYINVPEIEAVDPTRFDLVQPKYDGHWCRLEFDSNGQGKGFTTSDRVETTLDCPVFADTVVIGEHLVGTNWAQHNNRKGKIILFDLVQFDKKDVSETSYRNRLYQLSRLVERAKNDRLFLALWWPVSRLISVWQQFVEVRGFEGVVLRRWNQVYNSPLFRCKKNFEQSYICVGFVEGQGKHAGRLGAIQGVLPDEEAQFAFDGKKPTCSIGGGFTDEDREYIWNHQDEFLGREFDATGKQRFDTGALRHPDFVRWK